MQKRPAGIFILLCGFTIGLGGCQSLPSVPNPLAYVPNPFGDIPNPFAHIRNPFGPKMPAPRLPQPSSAEMVRPVAAVDDDYTVLLDMLEADNDRLKKELAEAVKDNARLKKDLADAMEDNSLLKDLAAKKAR
jgi:hypothetical protein